MSWKDEGMKISNLQMILNYVDKYISSCVLNGFISSKNVYSEEYDQSFNSINEALILHNYISPLYFLSTTLFKFSSLTWKSFLIEHQKNLTLQTWDTEYLWDFFQSEGFSKIICKKGRVRKN